MPQTPRLILQNFNGILYGIHKVLDSWSNLGIRFFFLKIKSYIFSLHSYKEHLLFNYSFSTVSLLYRRPITNVHTHVHLLCLSLNLHTNIVQGWNSPLDIFFSIHSSNHDASAETHQYLFYLCGILREKPVTCQSNISVNEQHGIHS